MDIKLSLAKNFEHKVCIVQFGKKKKQVKTCFEELEKKQLIEERNKSSPTTKILNIFLTQPYFTVYYVRLRHTRLSVIAVAKRTLQTPVDVFIQQREPRSPRQRLMKRKQDFVPI